MSKKKSQTNPTKVKLQPFRSLGRSFKWYLQNIRKIVLVTIIIAMPASFIRTGGSVDFGIIGSIAGLFLLLVLTIARLDQANTKLSLAKLYNLASGYFLRAIGVLLVLMVLMVAVTMSLSMMTLSITQVGGVLGPVLALLAVLMAAFFGYFLVRMSLAGVALVDTDSSVVGSFKLSMQATKKNFWKLLWAWVVLLVLVLLFSGVILQLLLMVPTINTNELVINLANGLLLTIILPIMVYSVVSYYHKLS